MVSDPDTSKSDDPTPKQTLPLPHPGLNPATSGATVVVVVVVVVVGVNIDPKSNPVAIPNGSAIRSNWRPSAVVAFVKSDVELFIWSKHEYNWNCWLIITE